QPTAHVVDPELHPVVPGQAEVDDRPAGRERIVPEVQEVREHAFEGDIHAIDLDGSVPGRSAGGRTLDLADLRPHMREDLEEVRVAVDGVRIEVGGEMRDVPPVDERLPGL